MTDIRYDAVIIGGGVIGSAIARELSQSAAGHVPSLKAASGTGRASRVGFDTKKEVSRVCFIINKEKTTRITSPSSIQD